MFGEIPRLRKTMVLTYFGSRTLSVAFVSRNRNRLMNSRNGGSLLRMMYVFLLLN